MPLHTHENLIEMFRERPMLAADLLADTLGIKLPAFERAEVAPSELNEVSPTEYRADLVVHLIQKDGTALGVVIEAQLGIDERKRFSWPVYVATVRARLRYPVLLLVLCGDRATANWCAAPISCGPLSYGLPDWVLRPVVIGPDRAPRVTDPESARRFPEFTLLSVLARGNTDPEWKTLIDMFLIGMYELDDDHAALYADLVAKSLRRAARDYLEAQLDTMPRRYASTYAQGYFNRGQVEGKAEAVLMVLNARGVVLTDEMRDRVLGCVDAEQLDRWIARAATVTSPDDLFS